MAYILKISEEMISLGTPERPGLPVTPRKEAERTLNTFHQLFNTPSSPPRKGRADDTPTEPKAAAMTTPGKPKPGNISDLTDIVPKELVENTPKNSKKKIIPTYFLPVGSNTVGKIYFIFSFVHIIFKIVCVSLYAAWINDESLEPANILNSVSSSCYNTEVKRLLMQIGFDNVALTGCRLFKITRGIILSIAGAVVTYELVLIQFNSATQGN
ncbi:unnamed protein product [Diabrotica balteata]|uniref:Uncharacterized protein n=1 Tax=Diabrotica balteata TaxID=107213 RepID=A0A9N9TBP7_DIABA|nr:unnamed protein product [Diabrotica balteata]